MSLGILGNKIGMTQVFTPKGDVIPVTIIKGGPCYVTQIKSKKNCGYDAIQLGYIEVSSNSKILTKPELGHFKNSVPFRYLKEYKPVEENVSYEIGQKFSVEMFKIGQHVNVTGFTIGKGFTGPVKKHHFNCGAMAHGSKYHRGQGSLGAGTTPGRVFPGKKMATQSGMEKRTILGLEIIDIDTKENLILVKGAIPGKSGNLVSITSKT